MKLISLFVISTLLPVFSYANLADIVPFGAWNETEFVIEPEIPMENNVEESHKIYQEGADLIKVHIDWMATEGGYDGIELYDAEDNKLAAYSGFIQDKYTQIFETDTIYVKVKTDDSIRSHGFKIDRFEWVDLD